MQADRNNINRKETSETAICEGGWGGAFKVEINHYIIVIIILKCHPLKQMRYNGAVPESEEQK